MKRTLLSLALLVSFGAYATQPSTVGGGGHDNNNTGGNAAQQQGQTQAAIAASRAQSSARASNVTKIVVKNAAATPAAATPALAPASADIKLNVASEKSAPDLTNYEAPPRAPVATAYAAPLTATNGTCSGSTSAGGQGASFGVSFGTTWTDSGCDARYDAEALRAAGMPRAAIARLCLKPEIAKAMEAAGTPCPGAEGKRVTAILTSSPVMQPNVSDDVAQAQYTDPIVRARLGLPPLN